MRRFGHVGKGATVQVTLPVAAGAASDADAEGGGKAAGGLLGLKIDPEPMDLSYVFWGGG